MLVEESPAFAARSRNEKLHIKASCAVAGFLSGQDGAVSDCIDRGILGERNVNTTMTVASVAGMPYYPEGAYELVTSSHILYPEGEGQTAGRVRGFDSGIAVVILRSRCDGWMGCRRWDGSWGRYKSRR